MMAARVGAAGVCAEEISLLPLGLAKLLKVPDRNLVRDCLLSWWGGVSVFTSLILQPVSSAIFSLINRIKSKSV